MNFPQLTGQSQLAGEFIICKLVRRQLAAGCQNPDRDGQIKMSGRFGQIGRSQVDGDTPVWKFKTGYHKSRTHPITRFAYFCLGQANNIASWQTIGQMDFHYDRIGRHTVQCAGLHDGKRHVISIPIKIFHEVYTP